SGVDPAESITPSSRNKPDAGPAASSLLARGRALRGRRLRARALRALDRRQTPGGARPNGGQQRLDDVGADDFPLGHDIGPVHDVAKLPDVARPVGGLPDV